MLLHAAVPSHRRAAPAQCLAPWRSPGIQQPTAADNLAAGGGCRRRNGRPRGGVERLQRPSRSAHCALSPQPTASRPARRQQPGLEEGGVAPPTDLSGGLGSPGRALQAASSHERHSQAAWPLQADQQPAAVSGRRRRHHTSRAACGQGPLGASGLWLWSLALCHVGASILHRNAVFLLAFWGCAAPTPAGPTQRCTSGHVHAHMPPFWAPPAGRSPTLLLTPCCVQIQGAL